MAQESASSQQLAIIGLGKMGGTIAKMCAQGPFEVIGYDSSENAIAALGNYTKRMHITESLDELLQYKVPTILAVKPHQIQQVAEKINDNRLVISIAAGLGLKSLVGWRAYEGPTVRCMPNQALSVRQGVTALVGYGTGDEDLEFVRDIFNRGGSTVTLKDEDQMHAVTGISGSGPAFTYLFIQSLEDAGVYHGLDRSLARELAVQTVLGAATVAKRRSDAPQDLVHDVTSPGGTTIAGVKALKQQRLEHAVQEAVGHAARRSRELGG